MKLRLGQPVHATDMLFGELGDIVVDPIEGSVTHLVVEPQHQHFQARLVPIWLVTEEPAGLTVQLDVAHIRRLERASETDYVRFGDAVEVGDNWDVGTEDVIYVPYHDSDFDQNWSDDRVGIAYDRIPKGDCEIRRSSSVITSDQKTSGHVAGFLAEEEHLTAIVVRCGLPGFRHDILVPFSAVAKVRNDRIDLSIDERQFKLLPQTDVLGEPDDVKSQILDLRHRAEEMGARFAHQGRNLVATAKTRLHRDDD